MVRLASAMEAGTKTTCYRHPDRETSVSCSMCARPICPDCMTATPVGMRCPECAGQRTQVRRGPAAISPTATPYVTYTLIALNVIAFLASMGGGAAAVDGGGSVIRDFGLAGPPVADGEWYRLVTGGFLHAGLIHLGLNMLVLYFIGRLLEPAVGGARFLAIYMASLLAGAFGALLLDPNEITVGASGAIFGLLAAAFVIARRRGMEALASEIGMLVAINLLITFTIPNISIGGHVGGLVGGALAALAVSAGERQRGGQGLALEGVGLAVVTVASVVGSLSVASG
jgi:membrane associated rhomboid family serine protease